MTNDYESVKHGSTPASPSYGRDRDISIVMMVLSVIEAAAALTASIKGCHFVCFCCRDCCCEYDVTTTEQVPLFFVNNINSKTSSFHSKIQASDRFLSRESPSIIFYHITTL
jgi:hypothetical protein